MSLRLVRRAVLRSLALVGVVVLGTVVLPYGEVPSAPAGPASCGSTTVAAVPAPVTVPVAARAAAGPGLTGYLRSTDRPYRLPVGRRPYDWTTVTPVDGFGLVDAQGVRMFQPAGSSRRYDHVVFQGAYALQNLSSYRLTGDHAYLDIALANGQRLVDRHVESGGAWYFPYGFDFTPLGDPKGTLRAPWYSGMAQGRTLSVFVRLFQATGDPRWRAAAHATFASLTQGPHGARPFGSYVDSKRHLWLEEYPRHPASASENVLNGHIVATWGVLDYWSLTGDPRAADLARGAIATVEATAMTEFRRPNASSRYSLAHDKPANNYHKMHVEQFLRLWQFTHNPFFVTAANAYRADYPNPSVAGQLRATPRATLVYRVNRAMRVVRTKQVCFTRVTHAPVDRRQRIAGGPVALRVSHGPYAGWWFPEVPGVTWLLGATDTHRYAPAVRLSIAPGTYSAYRLNQAGEVAARETHTFTRRSSAPAARSAIVRGRAAYYLTSGAFAGCWLPMAPDVTP